MDVSTKGEISGERIWEVSQRRQHWLVEKCTGGEEGGLCSSDKGCRQLASWAVFREVSVHHRKGCELYPVAMRKLSG